MNAEKRGSENSPTEITNEMLAAILLLLLFQGQQPSPTPTPTQQARPQPSPAPEEPPVITRHEIHVGGATIKYTAIAGMMPIKNRDGETEARMFFTSYVVDRPDGATRPLTFSFNGGPGSASVWLHMGAIGPKRVKMNADGSMPSPPFELVDNEATWLTKSDLVFIDPVGTIKTRSD